MSSNKFFNLFTKVFPVPKALSFEFVGIDICKDSIKVVKLEENKFGKVPSKYKEYKLNKQCGLMQSEPELKDCEELLSVLRTVKKDFKIEYANISIPEINTYIYKTKLPLNVGEKIYETLLFSIEENVPIKSSEAILDYFVVGLTDNEIEVIVTVVPSKIIESYTEIFESVGLKPISFEPETHAISRGVIKKGDNNQYLLMNLNQCLPSIAVIENEIVQYTQTLPQSNLNFSEIFNEDEARLLKENIQKIIIYWATSITEEDKDKIKNMYLAGENCYSKELLNYLEKNLPLNVKFANVWSNCFSLDEYIPEIHAKESLKYATAIGLSLKKIK